jgi:asparagine synthase (glutamine-hydrolysing)
MRLFVCLLDQDGRGIPESARRAYEALPRAHGPEIQWHSTKRAAVLTGGECFGPEVPVVRYSDSFAVGIVRLDNRADLERWSDCLGQDLSDLELVLRLILRQGTKCVRQILGDFAFVVWDDVARAAVAACDAFALRKLYYSERHGLVAFASRAELLAFEDRYEVQYLAEMVAACPPSPGLSVYAGVSAVPAASMAVLANGRLTVQRYWSPEQFEPDASLGKAEQEAASVCRHLLVTSVALRLTGRGDTWAQLSGGIDSSSVASVAQLLAERGEVTHGLAGTITYVDSSGTAADEREYSNAVARRWGLRNATVIDPPLWHDDNWALPWTDQPSGNLPFYPRERRLCAIVNQAGGRVLLTGIGGDELFTGTMLFFADWLVERRIGSAMREMLRRAALGRVSFWTLAYRNAILPLLPGILRHRLIREAGQARPWVRNDVMRRYALRARAIVASTYGGRLGRKYQDGVMANLAAIGSMMDYGTIADELDVRHPFLYRPLVEFALRLPPELCARPYERKWVLRQAMRGILPETVRERVGKGGPAQLYARSLTTQRSLLEPLLHASILADLGVIELAPLRTAFDTAASQPLGRCDLHTMVHSTLVIEAWLQMRSGRWPRGQCKTSGTVIPAGQLVSNHSC